MTGTKFLNRTVPLLAALATGALGRAAAAGELCVTCTEPPATYRCQIEGTDASGPAPAGAQVLCIKEMATRGGHASCSLSRAASPAPCTGALVTVALPAGHPLAEAPLPGISAAGDPPPAATPAAPEPDPKAPPATVEALAKEAAAQSKKDWDKTTTAVSDTTKAAGEGIKDGVTKAGDTVGTALKKSWNCMVSLFKTC